MMSVWELIGALLVLVTFTNAVYLLALKWILGRHQTHLDEKLAAHNKALDLRLTDLAGTTDRTNERVVRVERELADMKLEVSRDFVRRDDWIRFGGVIDAKLDRLRELVARKNHE